MQLIFKTDDSGTSRAIGYATVEYSGDSENETVVETTKGNLTSIFKSAKSNGQTLYGADLPIDAAIDDPLSYVEYLILDTNGSIAFDSDYVRE